MALDARPASCRHIGSEPKPSRKSAFMSAMYGMPARAHKRRSRAPAAATDARGDAPDRHRAVLAVQFAAEIKVRFELAEIRQHAVPTPAVGTRARPLVVIGRRAAQRDHAHHRAAAAKYAPLLKAGRRRGLARAPMRFQTVPEVGLVEVRCRKTSVMSAGLAPGRTSHPASSSNTECAARSVRRAAITQPAAPPPTMMVSKLEVMPLF